MRYGKISPAVYDRCIRNPLRRMEALTGGREEVRRESAAGFFEGCASAHEMNGICPGISTRPVGGALDMSPETAVAEAVQKLGAGMYTRPVEPRIGLTVRFLLTPDTPEEKLRCIMERIYAYCRENALLFAGADASVSDAAARDVLTVQAFYVKRFSREETDASARTQLSEAGQMPVLLRSGTALYMAGYAGKAGTGIIAEAMEERLFERFPSVMVEKSRQFQEQCSCLQLFYELQRLPVSVYWPVLDGGFLGALWEMGEHFGIGMDIDLRQVPVMQETIEICEYLDLHPYQLYSCQAAVFAVAPGKDPSTQAALPAGMPCCRIGTVTEGRARTLRSGEDIRFLDKSAPDALGVLAQRMKNL